MRRRAAAACTGIVVLLTVLAAPASGGEACSCTEKDPTTAVSLEITATASVDHSRIGAQQENQVVDLRGEQTESVGELPELLVGADLSTVPVLMAVSGGTDTDDGCLGLRPAVGADLSLTGHVYIDDGEVVVWTGPCQGELTVAELEPAATSAADDGEPETLTTAAILVGVGALWLVLIVVGVRGRRPPRPVDAP